MLTIYPKYSGKPRSHKAMRRDAVQTLSDVLEVFQAKGLLRPLPSSIEDETRATVQLRIAMAREACYYAYKSQKLALDSRALDASESMGDYDDYHMDLDPGITGEDTGAENCRT